MGTHRPSFRPALVGFIVALAVVASCSVGGNIELDDIGARLHYPAGWRDVPLADVRSSIETSLPNTRGDVTEAFTTVLEEIDRGDVRAVLFSDRTSDGFTETVFVIVEDADADLDAAAARRLAYVSQIAVPIQDDVGEVDLPIGPARRVEAFTEPSGGSPSHLIEYVVLLPDGRTLTLSGTGPSTDEGFSDVMKALAESLEAT